MRGIISGGITIVVGFVMIWFTLTVFKPFYDPEKSIETTTHLQKGDRIIEVVNENPFREQEVYELEVVGTKYNADSVLWVQYKETHDGKTFTLETTEVELRNKLK